MSQRSSIAWLILVAALAVPAVLFWNWWGKMKARTPQEVARPPAASAFGGVSSQPAAITDSTAAAPGIVPADGAPAAQSEVVPPAAQAAEQPAAPAPVQTAAVPAAASAAPAQTEAPAPGPAATPNPLEYNPSTTRDPTLSPVDVKRRAQEELQKELSRREMMNAALRREDPKAPPQKEEPSIESRIQLYGIIATPNGISALVNDQIVNEGDKVLGAVVKRITTGTVVFEYRKKVFIKRVNK